MFNLANTRDTFVSSLRGCKTTHEAHPPLAEGPLPVATTLAAMKRPGSSFAAYQYMASRRLRSREQQIARGIYTRCHSCQSLSIPLSRRVHALGRAAAGESSSVRTRV